MILGKVSLDSRQVQPVGKPDARRSQALIGRFGTQLTRNVSLSRHLIQSISLPAKERQVYAGHRLVVDVA